MTDKLQALYDGVNKVYNLGTIDQFRETMNDEAKRRTFYDAVSPRFNLGTYDQFNETMGYSKGDAMDAAAEANRGIINAITPQESAGAFKTDDSYLTDEDKQNIADTSKMSFREAKKLGQQAYSIAGQRPTADSSQRASQFIDANREDASRMEETEDLNSQRRIEAAQPIAQAYDKVAQGMRDNAKAMREADKQLENEYYALTQAARDYATEKYGPMPKKLSSKEGWGQAYEEYLRNNDPNDIIGRYENQGERSRRRNYIAFTENMAKQTERRAKQTMREAERGVAGNTIGGIGYGISQPSSWSMGMSDLWEAGALLGLANKVKNGEPLTDYEQAALDAYGTYTEAASLLREYDTRGFKAGQTTGEMVPFMAQMALNPAGGLGRSLERQGIRKSMEEIGAQATKDLLRSYGYDGMMARLPIALRRVGGDLAASAVLANTLQAGSTFNDVVQRKYGAPVQGKDGKYVFDPEREKSWAEAAYKAEMSGIIENFTEMMGEWKVLGVVNKLERFAQKPVSRIVRALGDGDFAKGLGNVLKDAHWAGVIGETLEEEYGIILNSLLTGDNKISDLWDLDQQVDIMLGVGLFGGIMSGARMAAYPAEYINRKNHLNDVIDACREWKGPEWDQIQERIDNADNEGLKYIAGSAAQAVRNGDESQRNILLYIDALQRMRGITIGRDLIPGDEDTKTMQEFYLHGWDGVDKEAIKTAYDHKRGQLQQIDPSILTIADNDGLYATDENGKQIFQGQMREMVRDYLNAKAAYNGMQDGISDRAERRAKAADLMVRSNDNNGRQIEATLRTGEKVHIISGEVGMNDGGADREHSSASIVIRYEDGRKEMVSPSMVKSIDNVQNTEEVALLASQRAEEEARAEEESALAEPDPIVNLQNIADMELAEDAGKAGADYVKDYVVTLPDGTTGTIDKTPDMTEDGKLEVIWDNAQGRPTVEHISIEDLYDLEHPAVSASEIAQEENVQNTEGETRLSAEEQAYEDWTAKHGDNAVNKLNQTKAYAEGKLAEQQKKLAEVEQQLADLPDIEDEAIIRQQNELTQQRDALQADIDKYNGVLAQMNAIQSVYDARASVAEQPTTEEEKTAPVAEEQPQITDDGTGMRPELTPAEKKRMDVLLNRQRRRGKLKKREQQELDELLRASGEATSEDMPTRVDAVVEQQYDDTITDEVRQKAKDRVKELNALSKERGLTDEERNEYLQMTDLAYDVKTAPGRLADIYKRMQVLTMMISAMQDKAQRQGLSETEAYQLYLLQREMLKTEQMLVTDADIEDAKKLMDEYQKMTGVKMRLITDINEASEEDIEKAIKGGRSWITGDREVVFVLPMIKHTGVDLGRMYRHEVLSHYNLKNSMSKEKWDEFLDQVWDAMPEDQREKLDKTYARHYKAGKSEEEYHRSLADEFIATNAENLFTRASEYRTIGQKIIDFVTGWIRGNRKDTPMDKPILPEFIQDRLRKVYGKKIARREERNNGETRNSVAYHGSGADFNQFDHRFMSTGEGSQVYGWGTYVSTNEDTGKIYANISGIPTVTYKGEKAPTYYGQELADMMAQSMWQNGKTFEEAKEETINALNSFAENDKEHNYTKEIDFITNLKEDDFERKDTDGRYLYTVEIPDDNGENYLHWDGMLTQRQSDKIVNALLANPDVVAELGENAEREVKSSLGYGTYGKNVEGALNYFLGDEKNYATGEDPGAERNSKFLNSLGFVGMQVAVDRRGGKKYDGDNYVIYNPDDIQIKDKTRFSIQDEETNDVFNRAIEEYGTTEDSNLAGYMLPDGRYLDFSEGSGMRTLDHRNVGMAYEDTVDEKYKYMYDFMKRGAIRIMPEGGGFELAVAPTFEQKRTLRQFIAERDGDVYVDFLNPDGGNPISAEYYEAEPSRVLADIDRYFNEGIKPISDERYSIIEEESPIRYSLVVDPELYDQLESGEKEKGYRTVTLNEDGTLGSPMAGRLGKKGSESVKTSPFEIGKWEMAEENPDMATDDGKINLIKPNGRGSVGGVDYNPYIHIRPTSVNKQFTQAWRRPELAYIETEYPTSELSGEYKADKAKLSTGRHDWNGGELILSRYDKPMRIVPWEEVADEWEKEFKESGVTFDIVPPALLPILAERGVDILPPKKAAGQPAMDAYEEWRNAVETAENETVVGEQSGVRYSMTSLADALNCEYVKGEGGKTVFRAKDGKEIDTFTPDMVKNSRVGAFISEAERLGQISKDEADKQYQFFADYMNTLMNVNDIDMVFAVTGAMGFVEMPEGEVGVKSDANRERVSNITAFTNNSDKQYSTTIDFTTICLKTQQVIDVMSEVMKRLGRGLTADEVTDIVYKATHEAGEPVPCPVCYVFSRWVGLGGLLDNMRRLQEEYSDKATEDIQQDIDRLSKQITNIANARKLNLSKGVSALEKELKAQVNAITAKYRNKNGLALNMTTTDKRKVARLQYDLHILDNWAWLTKVRMHPDYETKGRVPNDILFDINAGKEFADKYPVAWAYRTSRGPAAGKTATPYAPQILGQYVLGTARGGVKKGDGLGDLNLLDAMFGTEGEMPEEGKKVIGRAVDNAKRQNLLNGQRWQSTSDARPEYFTDYMLVALEHQLVGSKVQLYTKVPEAVGFFASIGAESNLSIMPKGKGVDEEGNLIFSEVTGMDAEDAFTLSDMFDNVQPILVGTNIDVVRAVMKDNRVTFFIPYHASGASEARYDKLMGVVGEMVEKGETDDFSPYQVDVPFEECKDKVDENGNALTDEMIADYKKLRDARMHILTGKRGGKDAKTFTKAEMETINAYPILKNLYERFWVEGKDADCYGVRLDKSQAEGIFPYEYWDNSTTIDTADKNGDAFVQYCYSLGIWPRFSGHSKGSAYNAKFDISRDTEFGTREGYWKSLIDRPMYNNDGTSHQQKPIKITDMSVDFGFRDGKIEFRHPSRANDKAKTQAIVDEVMGRIGERDEQTRLSVTPEMDAEYAQAYKDGDTEKAMQMVRDAFKAKFPDTKVVDENGEPLVMYHGTPLYGFTQFYNPGEYGRGLIWMTDDKRYAEEYQRKLYNQDGLYRLFADINNPIDIGYIEDVIGSEQWEKLAGLFNITPEELFERLTIESRNRKAVGTNYEIAVKRNHYIYEYTNNPEFVELLKEHGYDGVIAYEDGVNKIPTIGAVSNTQVKSAEPFVLDDNGKLIPLSERFTESNDIRYSIIGEMGASRDHTEEGLTRLENLNVAREMEEQLKPDWNAKEDENALKIKMATGWEKGGDGKWRYEVPDAQFKNGALDKRWGGKTTLGDIVDAPELFAMYPSLKDIKVKRETKRGLEGRYVQGENTMYVSTGDYNAYQKRIQMAEEAGYSNYDYLKRNAERALNQIYSTLTHELQHTIQAQEGFARGGSSSMLRPDYDPTELNRKTEEFNRQVDQWNNMSREERHNAHDFSRAIDKLGREIQRERAANVLGLQGYRRLAGETEARNASTRREMTAEQKRNSLLASTEDVARPDQIYIYRAVDNIPAESERFSIANANQAIFVSNAERAVEKIQQEKATPEQWLAMLQKNGGIKAGEDKWLGLSQWLKEQDGKISKNEILEFIDQNGIKIEEYHYSENVDREKVIQDDIRERIGQGKSLEELQEEVDANAESADRYERLGEEPDAAELDEYLMECMIDEYGDDFTIGYMIEDGELEYNVPESWDYEDADFNKEVAGADNRIIDATRLRYTSAGLDNKREIALTVPTIEPWEADDNIHFGDAGEGRAIAWIRFGDARTGYNGEKGSRTIMNELERKYGSPDATEKMTDEDVARRVYANYLYRGDNADMDALKNGIANMVTEDRVDNVTRLFEQMVDGTFLNEKKRAAQEEIRQYNEYYNEMGERYGRGILFTPVFKREHPDLYADLKERNDRYQEAKKVFDEREEGDRVLFIDEIQSNRHQEGREKGYKSDAKYQERIEATRNVYEKAQRALNDAVNKIAEETGEAPQQIDLWVHAWVGESPFREQSLKSVIKRLGKKTMDEIRPLVEEKTRAWKEYHNANEERRNAVPDAPFEKNWQELAMKRMLRLAAEEGYDKIAWTSGQQQTDRYNMGEFISSVEATDWQDMSDTFGEGENDETFKEVKEISVPLRDIQLVVNREGEILTDVNDQFTGRNLSNVFGKEISVQLLTDGTQHIDRAQLNTIGSNGMTTFYDQMLVNFMNKYGKQWGVKVQDIQLPDVEDGDYTFHSIDVTDQMKKDVMEGQTMFSIASEQDAEYRKAYEEGDTEKAEQMVRDAFKTKYPNTKVTDENGEPLVVYHKSPWNPMREKAGNAVFHTDLSHTVGGAFFSSNKGNDIKGWTTTPVFLNIEHPYEVDAQGNVFDELANVDENLYNIDGIGYQIQTARERGDNTYDGAIVRNVVDGYLNLGKDATDKEWINDTYVVVEPNQIKSAEPFTFDDNGELIPLSERFNDENNDIRYSFVGEQAASNLKAYSHEWIMMSDLNNAKAMERQGRSAEWIKSITGWEKGVDGKWRYEMEDLELTDDFFEAQTIGDAVKESRLLTAYPELNDAKVLFKYANPVKGSWFNSEKKEFYIEYSSPAYAAKALAHEIQHYIQEREGFAEGTSPEFFDEGKDLDYLNEVFSIDDDSSLKNLLDNIDDSKKDTPKFRAYNSVYALVASGYPVKDAKAKLISDMGQDPDSFFGKYKRTAGEVEARNVQRRMNMSLADRLASLASATEDVAREDQIIMRDGTVQQFIEDNEPIMNPLNNLTGTRYSISIEPSPIRSEYNGGDIIVYNPRDIADVQAAVMRETYTHKDIRTLDGWEQFMDTAYRMGGRDIAETAMRNGFDFDAATEQWAYENAERMVAPFELMMSRNNIDLRYSVTGDEIRMYLTRRNDLLDDAEVMIMKEELPTEASVRFSTTGSPSARDLYDASQQSKMNALYRAYVDYSKPLRDIQDIIAKESGTPIEDFENAWEAENQRSSKSKGEIEQYELKYFETMRDAVKTLQKNADMTYEEVLRYLIAKHGLERNAVLAQRDAEAEFKKYQQETPNGTQTLNDFFLKNRKRDYSGLTALSGKDNVGDAEAYAQDLVDAVENSAKTETDDLWATIDDAVKAIQKKRYDSGLISKSQMEHEQNMFQHYIPLRGFAETIAEDVYDYYENTTRNRPQRDKKAKGRTSLADDPLATIGAMAASAITQGNKNLVKQRFLNLVENHPTDLATVQDVWVLNVGTMTDPIWETIYPDITDDMTADEIEQELEAFNNRMEAYQSLGMAKKATNKLNIKWRTLGQQGQQHIITVRRGGKEQMIIINGNPQVARTLNGINNPDASLSNFMRGVRAVQRFMAANFTTRNPAFVVSNLLRDVGFATMATMAKEDSQYKRRYMRNISHNLVTITNMGKLIRKWQNGTLDDNNEVERYFGEFMNNGGETGYTAENTVDAFRNKMLKGLKDKNWAVRGGEAVLDFFELCNRSVEDMTRFTTYLTSRQEGRSIQRSIGDAKNITVNFNRKGSGEYGMKYVASAFLFLNAGIQSLQNVAKIAGINYSLDADGKKIKVNIDGKKLAKSMSILFGTQVLAGMLVPMLNELMMGILGGDDDDEPVTDENGVVIETNPYRRLTEFERRNNLCIWVGGENFIKIPIAIELRAFYGLGETIYGQMAGIPNPNPGADVTDQMLDLLPVNFVEAGGLVPDAVAPLWESFITNRNYQGVPIYNDSEFLENAPEASKVYSNTGKMYVAISRMVNAMGGGDEVHKSDLDTKLTNPAVMQHIVEGYLGGLLTTTRQAAQLIGQPVEKFILDKDVEPIPAREWPIVNRLYINTDKRNDDRYVKDRYYHYRDQAEQIRHDVREYEKRLDEPRYMEKYQDLITSPEYLDYITFDALNKAVKDMHKLVKELGSEYKEFEVDAMRNLVNALDEDSEGVISPEQWGKNLRGNKNIGE